MRVELCGGENEGVPLDEMPPFSVGVLTNVPSYADDKVGHIVIRGIGEIIFPSTRTAGDIDADWTGYECRPLRGGESVTLIND